MVAKGGVAGDVVVGEVDGLVVVDEGIVVDEEGAVGGSVVLEGGIVVVSASRI